MNLVTLSVFEGQHQVLPWVVRRTQLDAMVTTELNAALWAAGGDTATTDVTGRIQRAILLPSNDAPEHRGVNITEPLPDMTMKDLRGLLSANASPFLRVHLYGSHSGSSRGTTMLNSMRSASASNRQNAFSAIMHRKLLWPEPYSVTSKSTKPGVCRLANNLFSCCSAETSRFGGFRSQREANDSRGSYWGLVEALYSLGPGVRTIEDRFGAGSFPTLFKNALAMNEDGRTDEHSGSSKRSRRQSLTQEKLSNCLEKVSAFLQQAPDSGQLQKFNAEASALQLLLSNYAAYLRDAAARMQSSARGHAHGGAGADAGEHVHIGTMLRQQSARSGVLLPAPQPRPGPPGTVDEVACAHRIMEALGQGRRMQFISINSLLFSRQEEEHRQQLKNPADVKFRRIQYLRQVDDPAKRVFPFHTFFYQVHVGASLGGSLHYMCKIPQSIVELGEDGMRNECTNAATAFRQSHIVPVVIPKAIRARARQRYKRFGLEVAETDVMLQEVLGVHDPMCTASAGTDGAEASKRERMKMILDAECDKDAQQIVADLRKTNVGREKFAL